MTDAELEELVAGVKAFEAASSFELQYDPPFRPTVAMVDKLTREVYRLRVGVERLVREARSDKAVVASHIWVEDLEALIYEET